ncbi:MAG: DUF255 domain-containing protein [Bacteroidia bacterium]|nr:DUF255 domain-containing protein [Bacteroidia bacterium]MCZ2277701.1 DUF255 domain-containing protein [Bacteroidia bacterium]
MKPKVILFALLIPVSLFAQQVQIQGEPQSLVKWMSLEEAEKAVRETPKPLLIDFYTDWCGWCKRMMMTTYSSPDFASYINQWFYPVKFNAETKDTVFYRDTMFVNRSLGARPVHDFALRMLGQQLSYPTTVFITPDYRQINAPGYMEVKNMEPLVVYVVENIFRSVGYDDFRTAFQNTFYEQTHNPDPMHFSLDEYASLKKDTSRKTIVFLFTNWCIGCKVMKQTVFNDTAVSRLINDNFYLVYFDIESKHPVEWNHSKYLPGENGNPFHSVINVLTGGGFQLPTMVIFDNQLKRIDLITNFTPPVFLKMVLSYYGENIYLKKSWQEFTGSR